MKNSLLRSAFIASNFCIDGTAVEQAGFNLNLFSPFLTVCHNISIKKVKSFSS